VKERKSEYTKKGVKLVILGEFQAFPRKVAAGIKEMLNIIKKNERLKVNVALNYGGRDEILKAVKEVVSKKIPTGKINEKTFGKLLYTNGEPDPNLIIRTGGEIRLSNFLLWQMSYSELYFTDVLWPKFFSTRVRQGNFRVSKRKRNFGK